MPSNILLVIPWAFDKTGGVNVVVQNIASNLNNRTPRKVSILENNWSLRRGALKKEKGCELISYPLRERLSPKSFLELFKLPVILFDLLMLALIILKRGIGVVNFHYASSYVSYFLILRKYGFVKQLVLSLHGTDLKFIEGLSKKQRRELFAYVDNICLCSQFLKSEFLKLCPEYESLSIVIENGIDPNFLVVPRRQEPKPSHYILGVGSFAPVKGFDILIEAYSKLALEKSTQIDLVLIGKSTSYLNELKARCVDLGISSRVHFLEDLPHSKVADYYQNAELYVSSSRFESFGLTFLEAGLFSLPVIATRTGGALEVLENNESSILVAIDSYDEILNAMKLLLKDRKLMKSLGENLNKKISERFSWHKASLNYDQLYRR